MKFEANERFAAAVARFEEANSQDPHRVLNAGREVPRELWLAQRLRAWVERLCPEASEVLRLAACCQHLCRWEIPRASYPPTREGYHRWRTRLKTFHAEKAAGILAGVGYPPEIIERVRSLNLKRDLGSDPECQVLEDGLCLVFLEQQLEELMGRLSEEKVVNALRKSWGKMSRAGREAALGLALSERARGLIAKALGEVSPIARKEG